MTEERYTGAIIPPTQAVTHEIRRERHRQDEQWGEQNHPDDARFIEVGAEYVLFADYWKEINANRVRADDLAWDGILLEEVYEALAEIGDDEKLRAELIQVAAVAVAWVEAIDRRAGGS